MGWLWVKLAQRPHKQLRDLPESIVRHRDSGNFGNLDGAFSELACWSPQRNEHHTGALTDMGAGYKDRWVTGHLSTVKW